MITKMLELKSNTTLNVSEDTQFVIYPKVSKDAPLEVTLVFDKEGVAAELLCLFNVKPNKKLSLVTTAHHRVPNTTCNTKIKGVLQDNTEAEYIGKIIIEKKAQQTSSFLEDAVLVLGENTKNRSDPILEIEADDVSASHGATTGRIDSDHIYYLQSRGLNPDEAQNVIVEGFFESMLVQINDAQVREKVAKLLK